MARKISRVLQGLIFVIGISLFSGCKTVEVVILPESHDTWLMPKGVIFEAIDKTDPENKKIIKYLAPCDLIAVGKGDYLELERKASGN